MMERPPSPVTPTAAPTITTYTPDIDFDSRTDLEDHIVVTTAQLQTALEELSGYRPKEAVLNEILIELDRYEYVEWLTVTHNGQSVWEISESADRIADAIAAVLVARLRSWIQN